MSNPATARQMAKVFSLLEPLFNNSGDMQEFINGYLPDLVEGVQESINKKEKINRNEFRKFLDLPYYITRDLAVGLFGKDGVIGGDKNKKFILPYFKSTLCDARQLNEMGADFNLVYISNSDFLKAGEYIRMYNLGSDLIHEGDLSFREGFYLIDLARATTNEQNMKQIPLVRLCAALFSIVNSGATKNRTRFEVLFSSPLSQNNKDTFIKDIFIKFKVSTTLEIVEIYESHHETKSLHYYTHDLY